MAVPVGTCNSLNFFDFDLGEFIVCARKMPELARHNQMTIYVEERHKTGTDVWLGDERRKQPRADVDEVAYVSSEGASTRCRVQNISAEGAAIDVPNAAYIPQCFQLMTEKDRLVRRCRIVWIQQNRIGVTFESESGLNNLSQTAAF
jgi:hypothetical protein